MIPHDLNKLVSIPFEERAAQPPVGRKVPSCRANDRWRISLRLSALGALDLPAWHIGLHNNTSARLRILLGKDQVHSAW